MGGVRQFTSLLRKNLLLKTRRPFATCFEISMPLVLFLLLVWVRRRIVVEDKGPYYFPTKTVFPMTPMAFDTFMGMSSDSDMIDVGGGSVTDMEARLPMTLPNMSNMSETGDELGHALRKQICEPGNFAGNSELIADLLEPMLGIELDHHSVASHLMNVDASYTARSVHDMLTDVQTWDIDHFFDHVDASLKDYLVNYTDDTERVAKELQKVLELLRDGVNTPEGALKAEQKVMEFTGDLCDMGSFFMGNMSHKDKLRDLYLDNLGLDVRDWNASCISEYWIHARDWMEDSGMTEWVNGTDHMTGMTKSVMDCMHWGLDNAHNIPHMADGMMDMVRNMNASESHWMAQGIDNATLWASHFLHRRSSLVRGMGMFTHERGWMKEMMGEETMARMMDYPAQMLETSMAQDAYRMMRYMQENVPDSMSGMSSEMRMAMREMQTMMEQMSTEEITAAMKNMSEGMRNMTMNMMKQRDEAGKWGNSLMDHLRKMQDHLRHHNATTLMHHVLPEFEKEWRLQCPKTLNRTKVGYVFKRTQAGCPFYRWLVPWAAEKNLSKVAHEEHHWIANTFICQGQSNCAYHRPGPPSHSPPNMTMQHVIAELKKHQHELKTINASMVHEVIFRVIDIMQKNVKTFDPAKMMEDMKQVGADMGHSIEENMTHESLHDMRNWTTRAAAVSLAQSVHREINVHYCHGYKARRLQKTDDYSDNMLMNILNRKVLVTPYVGDAKKLMDLFFVEMALSATDVHHDSVDQKNVPKFFRALLRCPLVKMLTGKGLQWFIESRMVTFPTEGEMEAYAKQNPDGVLMALVLKNTDPKTGNFPAGPLKVDYSIRAHAQFLPPTARILRISRNAMFGGVRITDYPYLDFGFGYIQEVMGRAVARMSILRGAETGAAARMGQMLNTDTDVSPFWANVAANEATEPGRNVEVNLQQMPAPAFQEDRFIRIIQHTMPMLMILGWIYAVSLLVKEIVYEKQERLRDVMRIMGLKTWVYWTSWMASAMLQMTLLVALIVAILSGGRVLKYSSTSLVFVYFWIYSLATVSFSLLISAFFSRAKVAAACGGLAYYMTYLPYALFNRFEDVMSIGAKNSLCLFSSTGFGVGMSIIAKFELIEEGLQWSNFAHPPPVTYSGAAPQDNFSLAHVMMMMLIDTALYQVLAWYIEKVCPGTLGLPQPFYFPLLPSFWCGSKQIAAPVEEFSHEEADLERKANEKLECWETPPPGMEAAVRIRQLSKRFRNGKQALKRVTLDLHQGTILGLLGHNGAGKSTTMAILTGLYPPTEGDVFVNGRSVRKDSIGVRKQLGVCLQHNALYDTLTVEEHLALFCCLKSVPWSQMKSAVDALLRDTGLEAKRHARSNTLSGGMKRKLSIGISLSGGSQVVTLDEPTAGVDATSRRDIWQLLSAYKSQRSILLSTHFMDEADILSDRIAIIAEGQLTAIGTGMALKRHFADSYILTLVAANDANENRLTKEVKSLVKEAQFAGSRGRELTYTLPFKARKSFPALFARLQVDDVRTEIGVDAYGLSATTMEEVFLQASSVHEKGLAGVVRNAVDPKEADGSKAMQFDDVEQIAQPPEAKIVSPGMEVLDAPPQFSREPDEESTSLGSGSSKNRSSSKAETDGSPVREHSGSEASIQPVTEDSGSQRQISTPPAEQLAVDGPSSIHCMASNECTKIESQPQVMPMEEKVKHNAANPAAVEKNYEGTAFAHSEPQLLGVNLWFQQFLALFRKRALSVRRDRKAWASQLLLPAAFVFLALVIAKILQTKEEEPPILLTSDMYIGTMAAGAVNTNMDEHIIPFAVEGHGQGNFSQAVHDAFDIGKGANDVLRNVDLHDTSHKEGPMNAFFMENHQDLLLESYGAVSVNDTIPERQSMTLWFRNRAYHAIPVMINMWNRARFQMLGLKDTSVQVTSHPLPKSQQLVEEEMSGRHQVFQDLMTATTMILAMGFIPASFVVYLVHEKSTNGKHQQLLTGVSPLMYWVTSYFWDIVNFCMPMVLCFIIFMIFQVAAYSGPNSGAIFVLLLSYGLCMTPAMYCVEPLFAVPSTAYVTLICCNIFTGTLSVMATAVLDMYQQEAQDLKPTNDFLKAIFPWLLPNYNLGRGMIEIARNHYMNVAGEEFGVCLHRDLRGEKDCFKDPLSTDAAGNFVLHLCVMAPIWFFLRLMIEWRCCAGRLKEGDQLSEVSMSSDESVVKEAERVNQERATTAKGDQGEDKDSLLIAGLHKSFTPVKTCSWCRKRARPNHAVRGLNVGVPRGECFGLLGVNGAGKTTTMRMITGDTEIGRGDILVGGWSVHGHKDKARRHLGYCPQFDALPDKLTTRETLALYARIRGVPSGSVEKTVQAMVSRMCLEAHQHQTCEYLSGGNKRKLSTALSLIGEPDVVLLDEPSTGVDVGARRFLWDIISDLRQRGHAIVLTSHSMEECEVLCTRLTIMVDGQFQCLGTPLQLKDKYGGGYTLTVKAQLGQDNHKDVCARIRDFIDARIPDAVLSEESIGLLRYGVGVQNAGSDKQVALADIFSMLEEATVEGGELHGCVADYTISQTSLEEVFLYFSQYQHMKSPQPMFAPQEAPAPAAILPSTPEGANPAFQAAGNTLAPV